MKKILSCLLLLIMVLTLLSAADALVKKKKKIIRRRHYRRIVRNWPKGGPRPVFPKAGEEKAALVDPAASATAAPIPAVVKPAADPTATAFYFAEGGLAGGGLAAELGYGRNLKEKLTLSGAAGYIFGGGSGAFVLEPLRLTCDLGAYLVGVGIEGAFYSDKNLSGIEVFAARQFNKITGKIGYSSALGLRAGVGYDF
jgi:opacity protein-like surface antigen